MEERFHGEGFGIERGDRKRQFVLAEVAFRSGAIAPAG